MSAATNLREAAEQIAADAPVVMRPPVPRIEEALARVAEDVREVRKTGENKSQNFSFRGIDAVVNAVGPAFRRHGVVCLPMVQDIRLEPMPLSGGKQATRVLVTVLYRFHGPNGDHLDAVSVGEAFDMGDKATAKAMSVAYRTCLLQALTIPTDDPDPDEHTYEQAPAQPRAKHPLRVECETLGDPGFTKVWTHFLGKAGIEDSQADELLSENADWRQWLTAAIEHHRNPPAGDDQ